MNTLTISVYYRLLHDLRIKQAIFFSSIFPLLLFVAFSTIWGNAHELDYIYLLLTGVIGATITSEGLFGIGEVIKDYYDSKLIRYFRVIPVNIYAHFLGIILSRMIYLSVTMLALLVIAYLMYGLSLTGLQVIQLFGGLIAGTLVFSAAGLMISFTNLRTKGGSGPTNLIYFILIFISDAYYPLEEINPSLHQFANLLPLNHLLNIIRGEELISSGLYCLLVTLIFAVVFRLLFSRYQLTR
jgi:ABC-2 type transport system permease protein